MPNDSMYALKPEEILNIQQCQGLNESFIETQIAYRQSALSQMSLCSCNFLIKILNCQHAVKIVRVAKVFELAFQHSAMGFSPCTGGETFSKKIFHLYASAELLLPSC